MIVLKRLDNALQDSDNIRYVIRGSGMNQDGKTQGLALPNRIAQVKLIRYVYRSTGLKLNNTLYVEAHGIGTIAGDAAEIRAICNVFRSRSIDNRLHVSSVKNSISYLEGISRSTSLIKALLILKNSSILLTINV